MNLPKFVSATLPPAVVAVVVGTAWEALSRSGVVSDYTLPAPSRVFAGLGAPNTGLWTALGQTTLAATAGFAISAVVGITVAILFSSSRLVQRAFYPYAVLFQTVPLIAIAPLLVIWFDYSIRAVIASSVIVSVFPIIANAVTGLASTDPQLRDLFKLYRASPIATLLKLRLPFALPGIFTGLRVGSGLAVIGAIVGEFVTTGQGLGGYVASARQLQRTELVFAALLLSALLGIAMFSIINAASAFCLRHWHASEKEE
jgi:NitT/TauT family transport system permease protein